MESSANKMIWTGIRKRRRRFVIDVDTQNHFFRDDGPVCVQNHRRVLANIRKVLDWARAEGIRMISTMQIAAGGAACPHALPPGCLSLEKPKATLRRRRIHINAMDRADLPAAMVERYDQIILRKRCFDPFAEPRADRLLTELEADEFILVGTPTEGAVKTTALGLLVRGKHVIVVTDAIGALNTPRARRALRQMKAKGARLITTQTLLPRPQAAQPA